jgi:hypothetical protein
VPDLAGINLVDSVTNRDQNHFGPSIKVLARTRDEDFATSVFGTRAFLRECSRRNQLRISSRRCWRASVAMVCGSDRALAARALTR